MFCMQCGTALPSEAAFCPRCGARISVSEPSGTPAPASQPAALPTALPTALPPAGPPPVAAAENAPALRRASWIAAVVGVIAGLAICAQIDAEHPEEQLQLANLLILPLVFAYACWAWYWGIYRVYREREKFFFRPMRAVTTGLWKTVGANDPIGCIRIVALPFIAFIALATFEILIALLGWGSFLYGFLGGGIFEYRRLRTPRAA